MDKDNFDFKPLTKGLGFDKKADESKITPSAPRVSGKNEGKTLKTGIAPTATNSLNFSGDTLLSKLDNFSLPPTAPDKMTDKTRSEKLRMESFKAENFKKETFKDTPSLFEKPLDWDTKEPKTSKSLSEMLNSLPPSIDFFDEEKALKQKEAKVYKPIGRLDYNPNVAEIPTTEKVESYTNTTEEKMDVSLDNTLEKAFPKVGFRRPFFHQAVEVQPQFTEVTASFTSAVLDALVITGLTALLLVGLILLTGIDLIAVVLYSKASVGVWMELGSIFLGVYLLYYMIARGFWGSTLGDWAFDLHLGTPQERLNWYYPYQVVLRMAGIAVTGFVVLPILSFALNKDVAESYSKLRLYVKNY